jgi:F0F1-type ATP synthase alpha subunit
VTAQIIMLAAAAGGYLDEIPTDDIQAFEQALLAHFEAEYPALYAGQGNPLEYLEDVRAALAEAMRENVYDNFRATWFNRRLGL